MCGIVKQFQDNPKYTFLSDDSLRAENMVGCFLFITNLQLTFYGGNGSL